MIGKGFRLGRLFGIKVNVDWSWLFIFLLVAWNLTTAFSAMHPGWGLALSLVTAVVAALLFFGSVLAHELAHSLMAVAQGLPVRSITLFLFGGVSNIEREPPSPRAEFLITIVGPATSIILGILFLLLSGVGVALTAEQGMAAGELFADLGPVSTLLFWLGPINILLGVFNMIPGFPLDGGRILRSVLWALTGNLRRATRWASWVGQAVAWMLIITGVAIIFGADVPFFGSGLISGLWLAFIGWFLNNASVQSYRQVVLQDLLEDVPVGRIMRSNPPVVSPGSTLSQLVYDNVLGADDHAFPVVDNGRLGGMVCLHDIRDVPRERWDETTVASIMTPLSELVLTDSQEDADEALTKLQRQDVRQLPVVDDGVLVGLLRRSDILRWLQVQAEGDVPLVREA